MAYPVNYTQRLQNAQTGYSVKDVVVYGEVLGYLSKTPSYIDESLCKAPPTWALVNVYALEEVKEGIIGLATGTLLTPMYPRKLPNLGEFIKIGRFNPRSTDSLAPMGLSGKNGNTLFIPWWPTKENGRIVRWNFNNVTWTVDNIPPELLMRPSIPHPDTEGIEPFTVDIQDAELLTPDFLPKPTDSSTVTQVLSPNSRKASHDQGMPIAAPAEPSTIGGLLNENKPSFPGADYLEDAVSESLLKLERYAKDVFSPFTADLYDSAKRSECVNIPSVIFDALTRRMLDKDLLKSLARHVAAIYSLEPIKGEDSREMAQEVSNNPLGFLVHGTDFRLPVKNYPIFNVAVFGWFLGISPETCKRIFDTFDTASITCMVNFPARMGIAYGLTPRVVASLYQLSDVAIVDTWELGTYYAAHNYNSNNAGTILPVHQLTDTPQVKSSSIETADRERILNKMSIHFKRVRLPVLEPITVIQHVTEATNTHGLFINFQGGGYIAPTRAVEREIRMYRRLMSKNALFSGVSESTIEGTIHGFEDAKGFKLEPEQRIGVTLVRRNAGVMTGAAGSGKTTVAEVMTQILERSGYEVKFAAPTGKAAQRLSESVGTKVSTIHSMFRINSGASPSLLTQIEVNEIQEEGPTAYIFDEMAMADTTLAYHIVMGTVNSPTYFLGDVQQIPPIAKGMPFKEFMSFLPTAKLGVSKRSAANSGVNYNCNLLITGSPQLAERDDFEIIKLSNDEDIPDLILQATRKYLEEGKSPDSIQVLTPYATMKKGWSYRALNPKLQNILNPAPAIVKHFDNEYRIGDRVVQMSNDYSRARYLWDPEEPTLLTRTATKSIVNGEAGTIVGLINSTGAQFELDEEPDKIRHDEDDVKGTLWFMLVKVYDVELNTDVVVIVQVNAGSSGRPVVTSKDQQTSALMGKSEDLTDIELAYALTIHKSQGSQYPHVIVPLAQSDSPRFVNNNMIYTAVSRAQKSVKIIGNHGTIQKLRGHVEDGSRSYSVFKNIQGR